MSATRISDKIANIVLTHSIINKFFSFPLLVYLMDVIPALASWATLFFPGILSERSESKDSTKHPQLYNGIDKPKGSLDYARDARWVWTLRSRVFWSNVLIRNLASWASVVGRKIPQSINNFIIVWKAKGIPRLRSGCQESCGAGDARSVVLIGMPGSVKVLEMPWSVKVLRCQGWWRNG